MAMSTSGPSPTTSTAGTPQRRASGSNLCSTKSTPTKAWLSSQSLTQLLPRLQESLHEKVQKQIDYFDNNSNRMQYKAIIEARQAVEEGNATPAQIRLANQPLGPGAIESTCRQYQCRFKRTGQFWTLAGDEALMCLETLWRNGRWHELYPHAKSPNALN